MYSRKETPVAELTRGNCAKSEGRNERNRAKQVKTEAGKSKGRKHSDLMYWKELGSEYRHGNLPLSLVVPHPVRATCPPCM